MDDGLQEVSPMRMKKNIPSKAKYTTKSDQPKPKPERKIKMPRITKTQIPQDKQNALSIFLRKDPSTMKNEIETDLQINELRLLFNEEEQNTNNNNEVDTEWNTTGENGSANEEPEEIQPKLVNDEDLRLQMKNIPAIEKLRVHSRVSQKSQNLYLN